MTEWNVYVGTFAVDYESASVLHGDGLITDEQLAAVPVTGPPAGIERFAFDDTEGRLRYIDRTTGVRTPQYLVLHPTLPLLYAAECASPGAVSAFTIGGDGSLDGKATVSSLGDWPAAFGVHPSLHQAYVANWVSGTLASYPLGADGQLGDPRPIARPGDLVADGAGERRPKPHHCRATADGRSVLVTDAGIDELHVYAADSGGAVSDLPVAQIEFPAGAAPRHLEFHPAGGFVYVDGERDSRLHVLEADAGRPTRVVRSYSTLPPDFHGTNSPSELKIHPDGRTLYVANRGADCVTVFHLSSDGGIAEEISYHSSGGRGPRGLTVDPSGRFLLVANRGSGDLVVFEIDANGGLSPLGPPVESHSPSSMVFSEG